MVTEWTGVESLALRKALGLGQERFAKRLGMSRRRVAQWEHQGAEARMHRETGGRLSQLLRTASPDEIAVFEQMVGSGGSNAEVAYVSGEFPEVSWVAENRRDFFVKLMASAVVGAALPELGRLGSLLPGHTDPVSRLRIGTADIEAIEALTEGFRRSAYANGGGLSRAAATAHLQQVCALDDAMCAPAVRTRLLAATAELAEQVAWLAYDVEDHDVARKTWAYAYGRAREADSPAGADLGVHSLLDLSIQSLHLHRPDEALHFAQLASVAAVSNPYPISEVTHGFNAAVLAQCQAARGQVTSTLHSLDRAEHHYANIDSAGITGWTRFLGDPAAHAADRGDALYMLSSQHPQYAEEAVTQLRTAVDGWGMGKERSRAVDLPRLAAAYFRIGDIESGVATGLEAVTAGDGLSSRRCQTRLRDLDVVATPFAGKSDVAELRERIRTALPIAV